MASKVKDTPKVFHFSYAELDISKRAFVNDFIARLVSAYKIPKNKLDEIYTQLVNEWNDDSSSERRSSNGDAF